MALALAASGLMVVFAGILVRLSLSVQRFGRCGREGLLCSAALLVVIATARVLLVLGRVSTSTAVLIVSMGTVGAFSILLGVAHQHRVEAKYLKERRTWQ